MAAAQELPQPGQIVRVRTRTWLVEDVDGNPRAPSEALVSLACLDDDAQGDRWPDHVRDEVLARLLKLNAERADQESLSGGVTSSPAANGGAPAAPPAR